MSNVVTANNRAKRREYDRILYTDGETNKLNHGCDVWKIDGWNRIVEVYYRTKWTTGNKKKEASVKLKLLIEITLDSLT